MIRVRKAQRPDARLLRQMILEMGQHERLPVFATEERLAEDGFEDAPKFHVLIAEVGTEAAGYALFFDCYSSFQGPGIFLEDLFVRNRFQGNGVGRALLARIGARVMELGNFGIHIQRSGLESIGPSILWERRSIAQRSEDFLLKRPRALGNWEARICQPKSCSGATGDRDLRTECLRRRECQELIRSQRSPSQLEIRTRLCDGLLRNSTSRSELIFSHRKCGGLQLRRRNKWKLSLFWLPGFPIVWVRMLHAFWKPMTAKARIGPSRAEV